MRRVLIVAVLAFYLLLTAFVSCEDVAPSQFAKDFAVAFESGRLKTLDKKYQVQGPFEVYLEHSLEGGGDDDVITVKYVKSFEELSNLVESLKENGASNLESRPLRKCSNGVCSYDFLNGIMHNTLYLKELRYNDYVQCFELETVWLLDGD